jgi:hypothetical protein
MPRPKTGRRVSYGNAGVVESVESQKQASPSFHEPLGNPAKKRRDSHISTAPAARADGKVENQKQVSHFRHRPECIWISRTKTGPRAGCAPRLAAGASRRLRVKR